MHRLSMDAGATLLAAVWVGMLIGVSFLATPVKFRAATLDLAHALDVGRVTFGLFSRIEWGLAAALILFVAGMGFPFWRTALLATILAILVIQGVWLLPALNDRVATIIAGETLAPSYHHLAYAAGEATKVFTLIAFAISGMAALSRI